MKLLLVDDNINESLHYQGILEEKGYQVLLAQTEEQALSLTEEHKPCLGVFTDIVNKISCLSLVKKVLGQEISKNMIISIRTLLSTDKTPLFSKYMLDHIPKDCPDYLFLIHVKAMRDTWNYLKNDHNLSLVPSGNINIPKQSSRVLLVDDSASARQIYSQLLNEHGYNVDTAKNSHEALDLAKQHIHDIAIIDYYLPDGNGDDLTRQLISEINPCISIAVLSSDFSVIEKGLNAGAIEFISKADRKDFFILRVNSLLGQARQKHYRNYVDNKIKNQLYRKQSLSLLQKNEELESLIQQRTKELSEATEEAITANNRKSDFLSNMSHELRTPMHGILSYAKMGSTRIDKSSTEKNLKYFNNIAISGHRLLGLLNDLLDLSKLEAGKMELSFSEHSLKAILDACITEQQARLEELALAITIVQDSLLPNIIVDIKRISQVMTNLLSNAIKFSPKHKKIELKLKETELEISNGKFIPAILFSIQDHGKGLIEKEKEHLFGKFIQSSDSEVGTTKGTGLGLAISKEIIELHQGIIWGDNHQDGGAIFSFIIPQSQQY